MKTLKSLFMLCAGLSFCACSSDNEPQFEGTGMVEVRVIAPQTRTSDATSGTEDVIVTGDITIILTASEGSGEVVLTQNEDGTYTNTVAKFWNVKNPTKVTAVINAGEQSYASTSISTVQQDPTSVPAYGEAVPSPTSQNSSPESGAENDELVGVQNGDYSKSYQIYTAQINMQIPVARLEVSGITHDDDEHADDNPCSFTTLIMGGVYMDNILVYGGEYTNTGYSAVTSSYENPLVDYQFGDTEDQYGTGVKYILGEKVNADFLGTGTVPVFPAKEDKDQAYAYNFYAASGAQPQFKIYFSNAAGTDEAPVSSPRYAYITKFIDDSGADITFENGKIYRITEAKLSDANIIGDENGNTTYGVEVTVTQAAWKIVDIKAQWAQ